MHVMQIQCKFNNIQNIIIKWMNRRKLLGKKMEISKWKLRKYENGKKEILSNIGWNAMCAFEYKAMLGNRRQKQTAFSILAAPNSYFIESLQRMWYNEVHRSFNGIFLMCSVHRHLEPLVINLIEGRLIIRQLFKILFSLSGGMGLS